MQNSKIFIFLLLSCILSSCAKKEEIDTYNNEPDVPTYAKSVADGANIGFVNNPPNDGVTISQKAYADGKVVVYEFVLGIRNNVTESELKIWRSATRSEVVPAACNILINDKFYRDGLQFRYIYLNRSGEVLDDILLNQPACDVL